MKLFSRLDRKGKGEFFGLRASAERLAATARKMEPVPRGGEKAKRPTASDGQALEHRELLSVCTASRLADVTVTSTGVQVGKPNGPPDPAGAVLVITATSGNNTIQVKPSTVTAGAVDVLFNGQRSTWTGPIEAIVAHAARATTRSASVSRR